MDSADRTLSHSAAEGRWNLCVCACLGRGDDSNISCTISRQPAQKGRGCLTAETGGILTLPSRQKDSRLFYINCMPSEANYHPRLSSSLTRLSLPQHLRLCAWTFYTTSRTKCQGLLHHVCSHTRICHLQAFLVTLAAIFTMLWFELFHTFIASGKWSEEGRTILTYFIWNLSSKCHPCSCKWKKKKNLSVELWYFLQKHFGLI